MYTGKMTVEEYRPEWRDALRSIHMATASEHARTDEKHGKMSLALYCDEYLNHETVYVLLDEERGAVAMERGAMTMECGPAVMEHEPAVMEHGPVIMYVDMSAGAAEEDGMVCGGRVQVLLEIV